MPTSHHPTLALTAALGLRARAGFDAQRPHQSRMAALALAAVVAGCAHPVGPAGDLAAATQSLTTTLRAEWQQLDQQCRSVAELTTLLFPETAERAAGPSSARPPGAGTPQRQCHRLQRARAQLDQATLSVFDEHAQALAALADGKRFDLSAPSKALAKELGQPKDPDGRPLLSAPEVTALGRVLQLLTEAAAAQQREQALQALAGAVPELRALGQGLRRYWVQAPAQPGDARWGGAPYGAELRAIANATRTAAGALENPAFAATEPLRKRELRRGLQATELWLRQRSEAASPKPGARDGEVARSLVGALDAWDRALEAFARHTAQPLTLRAGPAMTAELTALARQLNRARLAVSGLDGQTAALSEAEETMDSP